jgi:hypothetical protein
VIKLKEFFTANEGKIGNLKKPIKSNITDPGSAKMATSKGTFKVITALPLMMINIKLSCKQRFWGLGLRATNLKIRY